MSGIENFGTSAPIAKAEPLINSITASDWRAATYKPVDLTHTGILQQRSAGSDRQPGLSGAGSDASTLPSFADAKTWPQVQSLLNNAQGQAKFTTAEDNQKAGEVPDLILGADGQLRVNPDKKDPPKDGKLNIQVEAKTEAEAKKVADELQKQAVRELISYFQKNNPKAHVPQYLLDQLNKQLDPQPEARANPELSSHYADDGDPVSSGEQYVRQSDIGESSRGGSGNRTLADSDPIASHSIPAQANSSTSDVGGRPPFTNEQIQELLNNPPLQDQEKLNQLFDLAKQYGERGPDGLIYFTAKAAICADGSPYAPQIDPCGQRDTAVHTRGGSPTDALNINYVVLPYGEYEKYGIHKGDMAVVRYHGRVATAVFGDVGPEYKIGEISVALAAQLGMNPSPRNGGTDRRDVEYMILPGTGDGHSHSNELHAAVAVKRLTELAGNAQQSTVA